MKWEFVGSVWKTLSKRVIRYLIKRFIGQYVDDVSQHDLNMSWYEGKGSVENVRLNVQALNEQSAQYNLPIEFLHGSIELVHIHVPYKSILQECSVIDLKGIKIVVQPKERPEDVSMFDSMWASTTSSLQLAEEYKLARTNCDEEDDEDFDVADRSEGLEKLAQLIDFFIANMKIRLQDASFKIEHVPKSGSSGIALEIKISKAEYYDEAGMNSQSDSNVNTDKNPLEPQPFSLKKAIFEGVSLFTSEFSAQSRRHNLMPFSSGCIDPSTFVPGSPEMPPPHCSLPMKKVEEPEVQEEPILISKLAGEHEMRLKLKRKEGVIGPKVDVEFNLGAFNLFLIPQQVHMLYELLSGILQPNSMMDDCKKMSPSVANKPMRAADFALVEQEFVRQQQQFDIPNSTLQNRGWSSPSIEGSDDGFQLMAMEKKHTVEYVENYNESLSSSVSSDFTRSDITENYSATNSRRSRNNSTVQAILQDQLSELTHFRISCSSCYIVILHDDSVQESYSLGSKDSTLVNSNKSISLKERAEMFFNDLSLLQLNGFDFNNFYSARNPFSKLCDSNHLRLMASSISIDGNEKSSSVQRILNFTMTFFQFEVLECLFNSANIVNVPSQKSPTYVEILKCENKVVLTENHTEEKEACFKMKYQQIDYIAENRSIKPPANKLDIHFGPMSCEFDISITDRIQTLLSFPGSFNQTCSKKEDWKNSNIVTATRNSSRTDINISSPNLIIKLRFPIPDLRSVHDMDRVPWWQQNLHKESLVMYIKEITICTTLDGDTTQAKYEVQCRDFHGMFEMSEESEAISFLRVSVDPEVDEVSKNRGFDWPRLVIHKTLPTSCGNLQPGPIEPDELYSYSLGEVLMTNLTSDLSPFSSSVLYGSKLHDHPDSDEESSKSSIEHEEVIKPADKETIHKFIENTTSRSELLFEFSLPTVNLVFPSKDFFELVYNRLGNDLLLWQKTAIAMTDPYDLNGFKVHVPGLDLNSQLMNDATLDKQPAFKLFSSYSNSDSEEEESNYYSIHEYWQRHKHKRQGEDSSQLFTKLSISLAITKGMLTINTPLLDDSNDSCGRLQLYVEDSSIFVASSYKGDPNEAYMCVLAEKSHLYHEAAVKIRLDVPEVQPLSNSHQAGLNKIIYPSEAGICLKTWNNPTDMLKVSLHIVNNPKQQLKSFKVAIDISDATLRHYTRSVPQIWINQLIDFLKVNDFPVNGYIPSSVVTEFHLNLSNCAIDYRPLKLPIWSCVTLENFNMSCNISATTPSFLFRIISEELRIFISNTVKARKVDLKKNYVCVVETGLIDISFRTTVEKDDSILELCISNNIINIRTCSDSFKALIDLVVYLSINGDMETSEAMDSKETETNKSYTTTPVDSNNLNRLVAEAMEDCPPNRATNNNLDGNRNPENKHYAMDEEFVILEDDPGLGLMPENGEPSVKILTDEPIKIVENHFAIPPGKTDVLKAPKHYPKPIFLLALRKLSLVWQIYGGSDFKSNDKKSSKRSQSGRDIGVMFADEKNVDITTDKTSVSFCKVTPMTPIFDANAVCYSMEYLSIDHNIEDIEEMWYQKGGPHRNREVLMELHLNKLQFQREVYPPNGKYASRYILLIHDIEIRDLLKVSQINKFLYQYSSQKIPKQSHANMVTVKASYTRPDPEVASEECALKISCKPLRLNIDQDALCFLISFFRDVFETRSDDGSEGDSEGGDIMSRSYARNIPPADSTYSSNSTPETFYRYFSFYPEVLIRIDYHGKHVQMEEGALRGFLLGLTQLNSSEIKLKHLCYRHGLLGHHKVLAYATNEWQQDILKRQIQCVLSGVGPVNAFVQLFQGIKDLFYLPVVQYQKDGQIVRGIQRGASSFSTCTAMAVLDLASRLVSAIQGAAILSCDMVSPGPSIAYKRQGSQELYRQSSQPADIREGLATAYNVVREGLGDTARTFYQVAYTEHEHKGVLGAVGGSIRQIPPLLFRPIILTSEATNSVLGGIRHQLVPDAHQEDMHKWKTKNS